MIDLSYIVPVAFLAFLAGSIVGMVCTVNAFRIADDRAAIERRLANWAG